MLSTGVDKVIHIIHRVIHRVPKRRSKEGSN
jgi:hypothetical protein